MTSSSDIKDAIDNLRSSLTTVCEKGIDWFEGEESINAFITSLNHETTGMLFRMKDFKEKYNEWSQDSSFKNLSYASKINISKFGWATVERMTSLIGGTDELSDLLSEIETDTMFTDLSALLQRTLQKLAWPFFKRVTNNVWRLDSIKTLIDRG
jgi:hypothetical protein